MTSPVKMIIILEGLRENRIFYPARYLGEFEDGYSCEVGGNDIGDCLYRLTQLEDKHGQLVWYGGLNDENYIDGEYTSTEDSNEYFGNN